MTLPGGGTAVTLLGASRAALAAGIFWLGVVADVPGQGAGPALLGLAVVYVPFAAFLDRMRLPRPGRVLLFRAVEGGLLAMLFWLGGGAGGPWHYLYYPWYASLALQMGLVPGVSGATLAGLGLGILTWYRDGMSPHVGSFIFGHWASGIAVAGVLGCVAEHGRRLLREKAQIESTLQALRGDHHELRKYALRVNDLAYIDELTGLYNYRGFRERLAEEVERSRRRVYPISLIMFDIDHFKVYNDTWGHPAGNEVLRDVAEIIRRTTRSIDTPCRFGGEEFAVILPGVGEQLAETVAERVRKAIEAHPFSGEDRLPGGKLTVSGGVASYPGLASTQQELIIRADQALYRAKSSGRNRVCLADAPGQGALTEMRAPQPG